MATRMQHIFPLSYSINMTSPTIPVPLEPWCVDLSHLEAHGGVRCHWDSLRTCQDVRKDCMHTLQRASYRVLRGVYDKNSMLCLGRHAGMSWSLRAPGVLRLRDGKVATVSRQAGQRQFRELLITASILSITYYRRLWIRSSS